jgi:hypothetical protein
MDFWQTVLGRRFIEGTMPQIERQLGRIAKALENLALAQENTILEYPRCDWCDHRHFPTAICLADDCECKH